jgi:hypothetical protein
LGASIVTVVRVDRFAAFSVNGVGLQRAPFPLSISVARAEGTWAVQAVQAVQAGRLLLQCLRDRENDVLRFAADTRSGPPATNPSATYGP